MAKHTPDTKSKKKSSQDLKREENLKKFEELSPKAIKHVKESLDAVLPCSYCDKDGNAVKKDAEGKCIKCHGAFIVPDIARRDWAAEEVNSRVAPKPKAVEMTVDDKSDMDEFEKELESRSKEEVDKLFESLNLKSTDDGNSSRPST